MHYSWERKSEWLGAVGNGCIIVMVHVLLSRYRNGSTKLQESIYNAIIGCNPKTIVYQYNACIKIKQ